MAEYFAREGSRFSDEDAETIGPELRFLAENGDADTRTILEVARDPSNPLHEYFTWDDEQAAEAHRRHQAREIANSIYVEVELPSGGTRKVRAFHSIEVQVQDRQKPTRQYYHIEQVKKSPAASDQVVQQALDRLKAWAERYETYRKVLTEVSPYFGEIIDHIGHLPDEVEV